MAAARRKSRKRSGASTTELRPEIPTIFLDRSLGEKVLARALRQTGVRVEVLKNHFPSHTPDAEWLPEIGRRGWVVFTKDDNIRRRPLERIALTQANVAAFVLTSGNLRADQMAEAFLIALPKITRFVQRYSRPFIARVTKTGDVEMIQDREQLKRAISS